MSLLFIQEKKKERKERKESNSSFRIAMSNSHDLFQNFIISNNFSNMTNRFLKEKKRTKHIRKTFDFFLKKRKEPHIQEDQVIQF